MSQETSLNTTSQKTCQRNKSRNKSGTSQVQVKEPVGNKSGSES